MRRYKKTIKISGSAISTAKKIPMQDYNPGSLTREERIERRKAFFKALPPAPPLKKKGGSISSVWNSVALFFNLPPAAQTTDYKPTTVQDVINWLDEGIDPAKPKISDFIFSYWNTLSYGAMNFGIQTPRDTNNNPIIPLITPPNSDPKRWEDIIKKCLEVYAEAVWKAAGSPMQGAKRWIPSIVLVHNYYMNATAYFFGYEIVAGGITYLIGDITHITYDLKFVSYPGVPANTVRDFWGILCHEYAHNFLEFGDLYGPSGCVGYWDLLGDNSPPGIMSEVSSLFKESIGWTGFKKVIKGPTFANKSFSLTPYTMGGLAIKVIPDPEHNPWEYFLLEYRKSVGSALSLPDRALKEEGLLIIHINERVGRSDLWLLREAPYFDPEFADFSDKGAAKWTAFDEKLDGVLFPQVSKNSFTPATSPNSNFYGGRSSGLSITNIQTGGNECKFDVKIECSPKFGWKLSNKDRSIVGYFTPDAPDKGAQVFLRNDAGAALLVCRQSQWFVIKRYDEWINGWHLNTGDYELAGDFDGDGLDEIYIRSVGWAGILKWISGEFKPIAMIENKIEAWKLGPDNWEAVGDFDEDGKDEIFIRSPQWAGILKLEGGSFQLKYIKHQDIDSWKLEDKDQVFVGRFMTDSRDDILVRKDTKIGLLVWDKASDSLKLAVNMNEWIENWHLGSADKHCVCDLDADGRDEIYIRSSSYAGVIKYDKGSFKSLWISKDNIEHLSGDTKLLLKADDRSLGGRFRYVYDGILHISKNDVALLTWENPYLRVRLRIDNKFNDWNIDKNDKIVIGDFHSLGNDVSEPLKDYIRDNITDAFIHNAVRTAMLGVNMAVESPGVIHQEMGLAWVNNGEILMDK